MKVSKCSDVTSAKSQVQIFTFEELRTSGKEGIYKPTGDSAAHYRLLVIGSDIDRVLLGYDSSSGTLFPVTSWGTTFVKTNETPCFELK